MHKKCETKDFNMNRIMIMLLYKEGNYFEIQKYDCEDRKNDIKSITTYIPFSTIFFLYGVIPQAVCHCNKGNICLIAGFKEIKIKMIL